MCPVGTLTHTKCPKSDFQHYLFFSDFLILYSGHLFLSSSPGKETSRNTIIIQGDTCCDRGKNSVLGGSVRALRSLRVGIRESILGETTLVFYRANRNRWEEGAGGFLGSKKSMREDKRHVIVALAPAWQGQCYSLVMV